MKLSKEEKIFIEMMVGTFRGVTQLIQILDKDTLIYTNQ